MQRLREQEAAMPTTDPQTAQDRIRFLRGLRAVRQFRPDPVADAVVDAILEVARWSGSASNRQPWELIVIRNQDMLRALAGAGGTAPHLAGAPMGIVLVMEGEQGAATREAYDEGRLSERIMLAADAYAVGSCIGWFSGDSEAKAKQILGVPAERTLRTAISLGYADDAARSAQPRRPQPRKPLREIVSHERYGQR
jgi:nitroreductase